MANSNYDTIIIGVGGMGSATLYQLAKRGQRVLGLEQFGIPHEMGSSHGLTRIIRLAYYENPAYVPLLKRAYALWREIEAEAGQRLLHITGSIDAGPADSLVFAGSLRSCQEHNLPHEVLDNHQLRERFPAYHFPEETLSVYQPDGGFLVPEACIQTYVNAAQSLGAAVHTNERVQSWQATDQGGVRVVTDRDTYEADRLVITAGAWTSKLLPPVESLLKPERQVLVWLQPGRPELFMPDQFPVFNCIVDEGRYYGFPLHDHPGFKFGLYHHLDEIIDPDTLDREAVTARDEAALRVLAEHYFPDGAGQTLMTKVCMFTNSPDEHFILDHHPDHPQVTFAAGFSGHGFKFCSVIGEIMADLSLDGGTQHDIGFLRYGRDYT